MRWRLHLRWPTSASPLPAPPSRRNPHQASGSPSLWHRRDAIFAAEAAYAEGHRDLPATVYMYVGEFESLGDGPRYTETTTWWPTTAASRACCGRGTIPA